MATWTKSDVGVVVSSQTITSGGGTIAANATLTTAGPYRLTGTITNGTGTFTAAGSAQILEGDGTVWTQVGIAYGGLTASTAYPFGPYEILGKYGRVVFTAATGGTITVQAEAQGVTAFG